MVVRAATWRPYHPCTCPPSLVSRYQRRISGPFIDRVDIFVEVPHVEYESWWITVWAKRQRRYAPGRGSQGGPAPAFQRTKIACNTEMTPAAVREFCRMEESAQSLLKAAMKQLYLSARAFHRILKLARTIADLEGADVIKSNHLAEAIQYRPRSQS